MDLQERVDDVRQTAGIPAVAAVEVSASGARSTAVVGVRRTGGADPVTASDLFHLGSNTKALTALLAALAVERGAISWDTNVRELFGLGSATLRQLLTHSSGLAPYTQDDEIATVTLADGTPAQQRAAFARRVLGEPLRFTAGSQHAYSNAAYAVAAAMVEAATDEPWEAALQSRIFGPLEVRGYVGWPAMHHDAAPLGHWLRGGELVPHDPRTDSYSLPPWLAPAGELSLSIADYATFLADQLAGLRGAGRLGPAELYRVLHAPDAPDDPADDTGYALGWGVRQHAMGPISMHAGSAETFYAVVVLQPQRDRGLAVMANSGTEQHHAAVNGLLRPYLAEAAD